MEKEETTTQQQNDFDEDFDYYYNSTLKINTKHDPGATRAKRIPIYKLKIEDENQIPPKPEPLLEKPNDKHYEKLIKEQNDKIDYHKKNLKELKEQISKEKIGNNPEIDKLKNIKKECQDAIEPLKAEVDALKETCKGVNDEIKQIKENRAALINELEYTDMDDFNEEYKRIQKKIGFGNLNAAEEKKVIEKKNKMDLQKGKIEKFAAIKARMQELNTKYGPSLKKIGEINKKLKVLFEKKDEVIKKLKDQFNNKHSNDPAIKNLQMQRTLISQEIDKCRERIDEIKAEWNDKWYYYNEQQRVVEYINEATKKINLLKKKAEKDEKRRAKMEKKNASRGENNEEGNSNEESAPKKIRYYDYEIATCEWLISYFRDLIGEGKSETNKNQPAQFTVSQSKIEEDLKKGVLKQFNKDDQYPNVNSTGGFKNKKKMKPSKENKKTNEFLTLDISLISKIKELSLTPPVFGDMVKPFLNELEGKLKFFEDEAKKLETAQTAEEPPAQQDTAVEESN